MKLTNLQKLKAKRISRERQITYEDAVYYALRREQKVIVWARDLAVAACIFGALGALVYFTMAL